MRGIEAILDILHAAGVQFLFGNPGTTELPLNDALAKDGRFRYIFGLHEIPVMAAADGYALASGQVGVVNVHVSCGLGNAMGMLYNAHCEGTPLLLTAGQQDRRLKLEEPVLIGDLVRIAQPWTKWAYEVQRVEDIPTATRRALQVALAPPTGPVFLALPVDVQMETCPDGLDLSPPIKLDRRVRPPAEALERAAAILASAQRPAILAGSRVTEAGAIAELVTIAEMLGTPVFAESPTAHGRLPFPVDHPLYDRALPLWAPEIHALLEPFDVLLVAGMDFVKMYIYHEPARPVPKHARIVHLDNDAWELGKNYPVDVALLGDPKAGLAELVERLQPKLSEVEKRNAREQIECRRAERKSEHDAILATVAQQHTIRPMTPLAMMAAIARALPADAAVVQEAITTVGNTLEQLGAIRDPAGYFAHRGWALGWGLGCALGVKLAWPDRPVLCLLGEGSALYGIQGLWTAAHHNIPVTFVICNNAQYKILKVCADAMPLPQMAAGNYLGMDLTRPEIDFVALARSLGVESERVTEPDMLVDRLRDSLAGDRPRLIDVPVAR